jgi:hypothetical protein
MDGSATAAAIGPIAEPTVTSTGRPTGTEADCGVTTIGGGVGLAVIAGSGEAAEGNGDGVVGEAAGGGGGGGGGDGVCAEAV